MARQRAGGASVPCAHKIDGTRPCGNPTTDPSGLCHVHRHIGTASAGNSAAPSKAREAALAADAAVQTADGDDKAARIEAQARHIAPSDRIIGMVDGPGIPDWRPIRLHHAGDSISAECHIGPPENLQQVRTGSYSVDDCDPEKLLGLLHKGLGADDFNIRAADNQPLAEGAGEHGSFLTSEGKEQLGEESRRFVVEIEGFRHLVRTAHERLSEAIDADDWAQITRSAMHLADMKAEYRERLSEMISQLDTLRTFTEAEHKAAEILPESDPKPAEAPP